MVNLESSVQLLLAKREELLDQIDALDRAVAALRGEVITSTWRVEEQTPTAVDQTGTVVIQKMRPKRVLSDEHKQNLMEGRRKARLAKGIASGEIPESASAEFVPALAVSVDETPRLVKKTARELTVVHDEELSDALEPMLH
jgi:hypothetical protein